MAEKVQGTEAKQPVLQVRKVAKRFPGVIALRGVDLDIFPGEVLALLGENGAGKSTLMKILAGIQEPDEGELLVDGRPTRIDSVQTAAKHGIAIIHQELNILENLDIGANIFLGREPKKYGWIDKEKIRVESKKYLDMVGLNFSPDELAGSLTIGQQQLVEIAKALSTNARIVIMDEPTSSLSQGETERLFEVIHQLRRQNVAIIYISHRLGEVKELADRVEVLRDGANAGRLSREEITHDNMVRLMVGRDLKDLMQRKSHRQDSVALRVSGLRTVVHPKHQLNFELRRGEVVGVAGLVGAGRTEMLEALFGVTPALEGDIEVEGKRVDVRSPVDAIQAGLALVPEDRKLQGVVLEMSIRHNISMASLNRNAIWRGLINFQKEDEDTSAMREKLRIKTPNVEQLVQFLSGGNQQKVVLGKWLALNPKILFLDEPTRGVDVGAKQEIYTLIDQLASQGLTVLFVSSEMEEVLRLADRAIVMHEGRITGELGREELTEEAVMELATGGRKTALA